MNSVKIGILGFGVVGSGTWEVLTRNAQEIARRAGRHMEIVRIATRTPSKVPSHIRDTIKVDNDLHALVNDPEIDIVVELIGGTDLAKTLILQAIQNHKHVVTANKALLAMHGKEIFTLASQNNIMVNFEAAVAGGIPIIKAMREGLSANRIQWVAGIINGTTNFILSQMREHKLPFQEVLKQAQALGYAEADPTFDIEGVDAAHKLTLLAAIAFGINIQFDKVYIEGITQLETHDVAYAARLGYRTKLLGIAKRQDKGIELRVHPTLVPERKLLASVEQVMNAVVVKGDAVGETLYYGPGAGAEPTASAVVADIVDVTRMMTADADNRVPHLAFQPEALADYPILDMSDTISAYYLRMQVVDQPGVLADITRILAQRHISIDSMVQEPKEASQSSANIIFLTHEAREGDVDEALAQIQNLPYLQSKIVRLRLENFQ
ncbi:homoserine dehydrogenase [Brackiella oedipodis]|uniref:homoserine dehydrogenase n=1 Tax=Brackiella oedipodis TaxID=124225 RepID=UPI00048FE4C4|nr:homoserine dehydrogenase [Brackiella oedipodis]